MTPAGWAIVIYAATGVVFGLAFFGVGVPEGRKDARVAVACIGAATIWPILIVVGFAIAIHEELTARRLKRR